MAMTAAQYAVVSKFTDAELRIYFLGFCAAGGYEPSEAEVNQAVEAAKVTMLMNKIFAK